MGGSNPPPALFWQFMLVGPSGYTHNSQSRSRVVFVDRTVFRVIKIWTQRGMNFVCGICGVIGLDSKVNSEAVVRRMLAAIVHRGPDEEGILIAPPVIAGSRRLSIIDLPGGSQPIWNETGTLAVIYNGEIYNFRELRKELEDKGHTFATRSDTEVIVHAYEQWGEQSVAKLRGMFALAIIEMPQGRGGPAAAVFLARDPLGIKPLYYALGGGGLLFASEVRALLASGCISPQLSAAAVPSYLLFGSVSEPMTMVEGVLSLPPGHFVKIHAHDPRRMPEPKLYWNFTKEFYATATPFVGLSIGAPRRKSRRNGTEHPDLLRSRQPMPADISIGHLKEHRRIATRYDKTEISLIGFVLIGCLRLQIRFVTVATPVQASTREA